MRGFLLTANIRHALAAQLLGIPKSGICDRLAGRTRFSAEEIALLADALDVDAGDLIAPATAPWPLDVADEDDDEAGL